jgi:hypothetical protein
MKKLLIGVCFLPFLLANTAPSGCDSTEKEHNTVERQQQIYVNNQPAPTFNWGLERHLMIELYTTRNKVTSTFTYVRNQYTGKVMSWCPSIGFPIPANTQLTNPHYWAGTGVSLDQAEPNGLFSSPSTRGTYVMCVDKDGNVVPRYYEQDVETYAIPMKEVNGELVEVEGAIPSIMISPTQK